MIARADALKGWSLLLLCLGWSAPCRGQPVPNKLITTTITRPGPVGQTLTVTMRVTAYDGPPADGFSVGYRFLLEHDSDGSVKRESVFNDWRDVYDHASWAPQNLILTNCVKWGNIRGVYGTNLHSLDLNNPKPSK